MDSDVISLSDDKPAQEDRSVLSAHIKTLETTLATLAITPEFAKHRVPSGGGSSICKETHHAPQTVGARIEECR